MGLLPNFTKQLIKLTLRSNTPLHQHIKNIPVLLPVADLNRFKNYSSNAQDTEIAAAPEEFELPPPVIMDTPSPRESIEGKVALITGGATGIGLHYGRELLNNGAKAIMIADLDEEKGKQAIVDLTNEFGTDKVGFIKTDVTRSDELEHAFVSSLYTWDRLDIVINNAAILDETVWEKEINVNCMGLTRGTLLGFEYMGKDKGGEGGTIVNIASALVFQKPGGCPIHVGTKYFTVGLGCSFGHESYHSRTGVKVLTLCPGITATPMLNELEHKALDEATGELLKEEIGNMPIQRPESVGQGLITVLLNGKSGSIWICEGNDMVYEVEISTLEPPKVHSF